MDDIVEKYKETIETALQAHDYLFLDNVYPIPLPFVYTTEPASDPAFVFQNTQLVQFWRETLLTEGKHVLMTPEIYHQAWKGYGKMTVTFSWQRKNGGFSGAMESAVNEYQGELFQLLQETRSHLFFCSAKDTLRYQRRVDSFLALSEHFQVKAPGHHDDHGADETVAASAIFTSERVGRVSGIITNDKDIEKLIGLYTQLHVNNTSPGVPVGKALVYLPPNLNCYAPNIEPGVWKQATAAGTFDFTAHLGNGDNP